MELQNLQAEIINDYQITRKEANALVNLQLEALCKAGNEN
jgi:hypothetical protein